MEGTFALGERRFFVRCLSCHCTSRIAVSEADALNDWNRSDGLLPALRAVRERCIQIIRDDMRVPVFTGAAATWIWRRLNDAALLELAGVGHIPPSSHVQTGTEESPPSLEARDKGLDIPRPFWFGRR